ncbi:MAG: hypothetical protein HYR96_05875 [Deltaproteobacteria bacterium]|nr:hypothetical protein [Deltaproteobacteria bacterium]MBI3295788.1 hypothetical protein [Deltaproteobacteria bacterium]
MTNWGLIVLGLFALEAGSASAKPDCAVLKSAFTEQIVPRIKTGVPFELMYLGSEGDALLCRQTIHLTYDLWDEKVSLNRGATQLGKFPLPQTLTALCGHLMCEPSETPRGRYRARVLLNPLWEGRLARFQDSSGSGLVTINWRKLASTLPSEKLLLDVEVVP